MTEPLLEITGLSRRFSSRGRNVAALDNVSISLAAGETLGLVGASGSGKSTLARVLLRLSVADSGAIRFEGRDWLALSGHALRTARSRMQMVFQDPITAFNPRATVASALDDPLRIHSIVEKRQRPAEIERLLARVGLSADYATRAIRDLSGGQRQRIAIARALSTRPSLIVFDEAVSALDVSIRGTLLRLLVDLQNQHGIAYLFISHDLAVVHALSHRVAVMEGGRIVETGATGSLLADPQSTAARALISAIPRLKGSHAPEGNA